ncbi:hypothetical protein CEUSTIGMA_g7785.t1 [Chlamydomonas eustigma]|uniref:Uncharacterized protein n=1 Tax=Chlamydomonas eustigma TaxID=1157962 RepID=A0A250XBB2_9CHLO|nr:hypothetical protein CEUSTIGMA_g7785.t1 [Chlamydomonas eustigma]|eukprot:GAX80346.1 hypothetical protein CEUSTIGMA_g7785.t1 [Chlamydomonas eustigma]
MSWSNLISSDAARLIPRCRHFLSHNSYRHCQQSLQINKAVQQSDTAQTKRPVRQNNETDDLLDLDLFDDILSGSFLEADLPAPSTLSRPTFKGTKPARTSTKKIRSADILSADLRVEDVIQPALPSVQTSAKRGRKKQPSNAPGPVANVNTKNLVKTTRLAPQDTYSDSSPSSFNPMPDATPLSASVQVMDPLLLTARAAVEASLDGTSSQDHRQPAVRRSHGRAFGILDSTALQQLRRQGSSMLQSRGLPSSFQHGVTSNASCQAKLNSKAPAAPTSGPSLSAPRNRNSSLSPHGISSAAPLSAAGIPQAVTSLQGEEVLVQSKKGSRSARKAASPLNLPEFEPLPLPVKKVEQGRATVASMQLQKAHPSQGRQYSRPVHTDTSSDPPSSYPHASEDGSIYADNWRALVKKYFPKVYDPGWHSSLYEFLTDLWPAVGRAHAGQGNRVRGGALTGQQREEQQELIQGAYKFAGLCWSSEDERFRHSIALSFVENMTDHDGLFEECCRMLPKDLLAEGVVPAFKALHSPVYYTTFLSLARDRMGLDWHPAPRHHKKWRTLVEQLESMKRCHPEVDITVLAYLDESFNVDLDYN